MIEDNREVVRCTEPPTGLKKRIVSISISPDTKEKIMDKLGEKIDGLQMVLDSMSANATAVLARLPRAEQRKILEMENSSERDDELSMYRLVAVKKDELFTKRQIVKEKVEEARAKASLAKERYNELKIELEQRKQEMDKAISEKQQNKTIENGRRYLQNAADVMITALERVRSNIEMNGYITDEELSQMGGRINASIENITDAKSLIQAADTKEGLEAAKKALLASIKAAKPVLKDGSELLIDSKLSEIVKRDEVLEAKLDCTLTAMKNNGTDVSVIEGKLDEFSADVASAKASIAAGEMPDASQSLNDAHKIVKEMVRMIKEEGGEITECAAPVGINEGEVLIAEEQV
jgi:hypothetical protein